MNGNNGLNAWIAYKLFVPLHSNAGFLTCNKLFFLCDIIMGPCINRGNIEFSDIVNSECVEKASLIPLMNITLNSERRYSCVKCCRRLKRRKIKGYILGGGPTILDEYSNENKNMLR